MDEKLVETETVLEDEVFQRLFPIKTAEEAANVIIYLLSVGDDPNLALISLILPLVQISIAGHGSSGNGGKGRAKKIVKHIEREFVPIRYESIFELWGKFKNLLPDCRRNKKRRRSSSPGIAAVSQDLDAIYAFVRKVIHHRRAADKCPSMAMSIYKFINSECNSVLTIDETKLVTAVIAKLCNVDEVHVCLSESTVFLNIGNPKGSGKMSAGVADLDFSLVFGSDVVEDAPIRDLFMYSGGKLVSCDDYMLVAYLVSSMQNYNSIHPSLGRFQRIILKNLYDCQKLNRFPMALAAYAALEAAQDTCRLEDSRADVLFRRAIEINQKYFDNAFVYPYLLYAKYLFRMEDYAAALVPIHLAAKAASQYVYAKLWEMDTALHSELLNLAEREIPTIISKTLESHHPCIASLLLAFIDEICLWEQKSNTLIFHITWGKALIPCLTKVVNSGLLRHVAVHTNPSTYYRKPGAQLVRPSSSDLTQYTELMIENMRELPEKNFTEREDFSHLLPKSCLGDKNLCLRLLDCYKRWPPLHAFDPRYIDKNVRLVELPEATSENFLAVLKEFQDYAPVDLISEEDLEVFSCVRKVNPLYRICHGHVFPFVDMGPPNIAIYCFDLNRIVEEILVPPLGSRENHIVAALHRQVSILEKEETQISMEKLVNSPFAASPSPDIISTNGDSGVGSPSQQPLKRIAKRKRVENGSCCDGSVYTEVLLMSRKMQGIRDMLVSERYSQSEIHLKLEAPVYATATEDRSRRKKPRFDMLE